MGNFSDIASTGFGASFRYEAGIKDQLNWTASIGYLSFGEKTYRVNNVSIPFGSTSLIPITGGIKYYFSAANSGFYGSADLGLNFISTYVYTYNSGNGGGYNLSSVSETKLGFSPGIGYRTGSWDFGGKFNIISDRNYFGVRVAYVFGNK